MTLTLDAVSRAFGTTRVLREVSFTADAGRLTGFVGPNGAGKTTTMRIVLGVLAADSGAVTWHGAPVDAGVRHRFGYMPEERGLYPKMGVREQLDYLARLYGMTPAAARRAGEDLLERLDLAPRAKEPLERLSLGNQQRVQIAAALVHAPELLVLDEPFSGLDPVAVDTIVALLRERAAAGTAVLFSSHQLELVERLCDALVVIAGGTVRAAGPHEELRRTYGGRRYALRTDAPTDWLDGVPGVRVLARAGDEATITLDGADDQWLLREALARGPVRAFGPVVPPLADVFREVIR
ncbi:MAG TPA: ATP-binding cassette domain-containing protein [Pilimelia sp.]|nr:ATP-binding cassette domain-containing protein [Pilimelia sp.]